MDWVEELIEKIKIGQGKVQVIIENNPVIVEMGSEFVTYFNDNRPLILKIGKDTFTSFLVLLSEKKEEAAFNVLLAKMDADEIIARMLANASELSIDTDTREKFVESLKKFAFYTLTPLVLKAVISLLLPIP